MLLNHAVNISRARSQSNIHYLVKDAIEHYSGSIRSQVERDPVGHERSVAWSWVDTDGLPVIRPGPRGGLTLSRLDAAASRRASRLLAKTLLRE